MNQNYNILWQDKAMCTNSKTQSSWLRTSDNGRGRQEMFANANRPQSSRLEDSGSGWQDQEIMANNNRSQPSWSRFQENERGCQGRTMFANTNRSQSSFPRPEEIGRGWQDQGRYTNTIRSKSFNAIPEENRRGWQDQEILANNNRSQPSWSRFQENEGGCQNQTLFANTNNSQSSFPRPADSGKGWQDQGRYTKANRSQSFSATPEKNVSEGQDQEMFANINLSQSSWNRPDKNGSKWQERDTFSNTNRYSKSSQPSWCSTADNGHTTNKGMENARIEVLGKISKYLGKTPNTIELESYRNSTIEARKTVEELKFENSRLKIELGMKKECIEFQKTFEVRQKLPVMQYRANILNAIRTYQVVLVVGSDGCGKTTQISQMLLDDSIFSNSGSECRMVCVQKDKSEARRVAERVAFERAETVGNSIGYHVGGGKKLPREYGSIFYCTSRILIIKLATDPFLNNVSAVILDDILEHDGNACVVMELLNIILPHRSELKVILLSSPTSKDGFLNYFKNPYLLYIDFYSSETETEVPNREEVHTSKATSREDRLTNNYIQDMNYLKTYEGIDHCLLSEDVRSSIEKRTQSVMEIQEKYPHVVAECEKEVSQFTSKRIRETDWKGYIKAKEYVQKYEDVDPNMVAKCQLIKIEQRKKIINKMEKIYPHVIADFQKRVPYQATTKPTWRDSDKVGYINSIVYLKKYEQFDSSLISKSQWRAIEKRKIFVANMQSQYPHLIAELPQEVLELKQSANIKAVRRVNTDEQSFSRGANKRERLASPICDPNLKVAIVDLSQQNGRISTERWLKLEGILLAEMMSDKWSGESVSFVDANWSMGVKLIQCGNERSLLFLRVTITNIGELWPASHLEVVPLSVLPLETRAKMWIPPPVPSTETILSLIEKQNNELDTKYWKIINSTPCKGNFGVDYHIFVDAKSAKQLRACKGRVNFGLKSINIRIDKK